MTTSEHADYTPTDAVLLKHGTYEGQLGPDFDRWLAAHDAEVTAAALASTPSPAQPTEATDEEVRDVANTMLAASGEVITDSRYQREVFDKMARAVLTQHRLAPSPAQPTEADVREEWSIRYPRDNRHDETRTSANASREDCERINAGFARLDGQLEHRLVTTTAWVPATQALAPSPAQPTEAGGWEAVAADLEYRLTQIAFVLSKYDETDEGSTVPQCAPEDRWRLYRDIIAIIERGNMDEVPPHFDPADQGRIIDIVSDAIKHNFGATMSTHRDGDTMVVELTSWPRAQEAMRALEDAGFRAERIKGTGQSIRTWRAPSTPSPAQPTEASEAERKALGLVIRDCMQKGGMNVQGDFQFIHRAIANAVQTAGYRLAPSREEEVGEPVEWRVHEEDDATCERCNERFEDGQIVYGYVHRATPWQDDDPGTTMWWHAECPDVDALAPSPVQGADDRLAQAEHTPSTEWLRIMVGYAMTTATDRTLPIEQARAQGYEWFDRWLATCQRQGAVNNQSTDSGEKPMTTSEHADLTAKALEAIESVQTDSPRVDTYAEGNADAWLAVKAALSEPEEYDPGYGPEDADLAALASTPSPAQPTEAGDVTIPADGQWVHCSPALIKAGVNCHATPRRGCECDHGGSHDHFIAFALPVTTRREKVESIAAWLDGFDWGGSHEWADAGADRVSALIREFYPPEALAPSPVQGADDRLAQAEAVIAAIRTLRPGNFGTGNYGYDGEQVDATLATYQQSPQAALNEVRAQTLDAAGERLLTEARETASAQREHDLAEGLPLIGTSTANEIEWHQTGNWAATQLKAMAAELRAAPQTEAP